MKTPTTYAERVIEQYHKGLIDELSESLVDMLSDENGMSIDVRVTEMSRLTYIDHDDNGELVITEEYMDDDFCKYARSIYLGDGDIARSYKDELSIDTLYALWKYLTEN